MRIKEFVAICACWVCLAPTVPIWGLAVLGEWLTEIAESGRDWRWVQACVDVTERIELWQREPEPPAGVILTRKYRGVIKRI